MQVFISWSGARSKAVAELLDEWIQCVLQAVRPWMSSKDIDRGSVWFAEITDQLKDTKIGIVCLTKDNLNKPWILFESGALAKGISSARVCTFLIDLDPTDVGNPLAQFNHTLPNRDGMYELVRTLNSSLGEQALREKVLEQVYEIYWPKFESDFKKVLADNPVGETEPVRSEESIFAEMLDTLRSLDRRVRKIEIGSPEIKDRQRGIITREIERNMQNEIHNLINSGIPLDAIEEIFADRMPRELVRRIVRKFMIARDDGPHAVYEFNED